MSNIKSPQPTNPNSCVGNNQQLIWSWGSWQVGGIDLGSTEEQEVIESKSKDKCCCKSCKEINEYAEPNMPDGSFMCYKCRHGH